MACRFFDGRSRRCQRPRRHNYVGHNYLGHHYLGHNYLGHNYLGHNYLGYNYLGHNYLGHNYLGHGGPTGWYLPIGSRAGTCTQQPKNKIVMLTRGID